MELVSVLLGPFLKYCHQTAKQQQNLELEKATAKLLSFLETQEGQQILESLKQETDLSKIQQLSKELSFINQSMQEVTHHLEQGETRQASQLLASYLPPKSPRAANLRTH
jgi:dsDNA-specific endonuclease/ATPase MutS2